MELQCIGHWTVWLEILEYPSDVYEMIMDLFWCGYVSVCHVFDSSISVMKATPEQVICGQLSPADVTAAGISLIGCPGDGYIC